MLDSQGLGRYTVEKLASRRLVKRHVDFTLCVKYVRIFVSLVKTHQRLTLAEKEFHNRVDIMTHSMDFILQATLLIK